MANVLTLADAAERAGVAASTLRWQIRNGRLKASKIGPVWTVTVAELDRYVRDSKGKPGPRPKAGRK